MGHDNHAQGHGGADHHPHVLPISVYLKTFGALVVLTIITVAASRVDLGPLNLPLALAIATTKATIVALMFMHLFWDQKFFSIIIASSVIFLVIFVAFTMFDTEARGIADPFEKERPADPKNPFVSGTVSEKKAAQALAKERAAMEKRVADEAKRQAPMLPPPPSAPAPTPAPGGAAPAPGGAAPAPGGAAPAPSGAAPAPSGAAPAAPTPGTPPTAPAPR
jgi:cytochrome c oxidase subunit 4